MVTPLPTQGRKQNIFKKITREGYQIIYINIWLVCGPLHTLSLEILTYSNQLMTAIVIKNSYESLVF